MRKKEDYRVRIMDRTLVQRFHVACIEYNIRPPELATFFFGYCLDRLDKGDLPLPEAEGVDEESIEDDDTFWNRDLE